MNVNEVFASIQGEGRFVGRPQAFVRLTGCNMQCSWCDTRYAFEGGEDLSVDKVLDKIAATGLTSVCVTGGEPLLQVDEVRELVKKLKEKDYEVVLETNGSLYDKEVFELVDCISFDVKPPSSGEESDLELLSKLRPGDQVKVVVADDIDYEYAKKVSDGVEGVEVILQPINLDVAKDLTEKVVRDKLDVRVIPQLHKIIGVK